MRSSVLRLSTTRTDLDVLFSNTEVVLTKSGGNISICDDEDPAVHQQVLNSFLEDHGEHIKDLMASGASAELDLGLGVGSAEQFTASASFSPTFLRRIAECGVILRVSAYPVSDDD